MLIDENPESTSIAQVFQGTKHSGAAIEEFHSQATALGDDISIDESIALRSIHRGGISTVHEGRHLGEQLPRTKVGNGGDDPASEGARCLQILDSLVTDVGINLFRGHGREFETDQGVASQRLEMTTSQLPDFRLIALVIKGKPEILPNQAAIRDGKKISASAE